MTEESRTLLEKIKKVVSANDDRMKEVRQAKAKALALKSTGYGYWENPKGETFTWSDETREFVKSEDGAGSSNPKQYFIDKFGMTDIGDNKLTDKFGQVWELNFKKRALVKISKNRSFEDGSVSKSKK